jgi:hypothetical protein
LKINKKFQIFSYLVSRFQARKKLNLTEIDQKKYGASLTAQRDEKDCWKNIF